MNDSEQPPRPRRRDAVANREAILAAAARVLRDDPEASVDAVAVEAGLSRRSVYGHFASRDDLLAELVSRGAERIAAALADVHGDDPARHLARLGVTLWNEVAHVRIVAQMVVHSPLEKAVGRGLAPVRRSVRDGVERGAASGAFRTDVDPEIVSRLIEESALAVLDEVVRRGLADAEAQYLVIVTALGVAGLGWQQAQAVARGVTQEDAR